jgi:hypothetical protein
MYMQVKVAAKCPISSHIVRRISELLASSDDSPHRQRVFSLIACSVGFEVEPSADFLTRNLHRVEVQKPPRFAAPYHASSGLCGGDAARSLAVSRLPYRLKLFKKTPKDNYPRMLGAAREAASREEHKNLIRRHRFRLTDLT